ncbi:MAG: carbohydrate-binding protein [Ruminococcus sp.]|nr:carbohydrate-binding protein [Ruminococcus sp.]
MKRMIRIVVAAVVGMSAVMACTPTIFADNPIVQTNYTADPAPMVYNDTMYIYTSHDLDGSTYFTMPDWKCYSSTDMQNWTDLGTVLSYTDFTWAEKDTAWAAQCVERNGKFYMYVTLVPAATGGRAIGVAVADNPAGPFKDALGKPLCGPNWDYIDPTVFIDDDGQAYLYFGNPTLNYVKLNEDMISYSGQVNKIELTTAGFGSRPNGDERHPTLYEEGPWFYKRGNLYYMVYAASGIPENICYSTSPNPTGPWTFRGEIMSSGATGGGSFTNHPGIVDYRGKSYFAYHNGSLPGGGGFTRSVCIEEFSYNADGTIPKLSNNKNGPAQIEAVDPYIRNEAEKICWESGVETEKCSEGGVNVANIENGDYIKVKGVDFGEGASSFTASVASAESGGKIEIHLDSVSGPVVGTCNVTGTGGWQNWQEVTCDVAGAEGEHDLYFRYSGGSGFLFNVDWWQFSGSGGGPSEEGYYFNSTFEKSDDGWSGRGGASVGATNKEAYQGDRALYVSDRTASWNGATKKLSTSYFKKGESYSFSAEVMQNEGSAAETVMMKLQYTNASGETQYDTIATATAIKGEWVQLANTEYKIPADASNMEIYLETESGTTSFYVDHVIGALPGTEVEGSGSFNVIKADIDMNGKVNAFDIACAKKGLVKDFPSAAAALAADVDENGEFEVVDVVQIVKFVMGRISAFTVAEKPTEPPTEPEKEAMSMAEFTAQCASKMVEFEPNNSHQEQGGVQYGTVKSGSYYSTTCKRNKPYNILLPANYSENKKYPVLYVMHGYWENQDRMIIKGNGTMYTRQIIGNAIASGEAEDMIVVFPYIYSSDSQDSCSGMDDFNNRAYDNFINDLIKDLMPHIESTYSVKTGKNNTAITGFSMGGREALLIGMQRSDLFGYIGAICPAPGVSGAFKWDSGKEPYLVMITAGSNDTVVYNNPENYHNNFTKNNVPHLWHYCNGGYHGDNCIHAHLYNFSRYVFKATK